VFQYILRTYRVVFLSLFCIMTCLMKIKHSKSPLVLLSLMLPGHLTNFKAVVHVSYMIIKSVKLSCH